VHGLCCFSLIKLSKCAGADALGDYIVWYVVFLPGTWCSSLIRGALPCTWCSFLVRGVLPCTRYSFLVHGVLLFLPMSSPPCTWSTTQHTKGSVSDPARIDGLYNTCKQSTVFFSSSSHSHNHTPRNNKNHHHSNSKCRFSRHLCLLFSSWALCPSIAPTAIMPKV